MKKKETAKGYRLLFEKRDAAKIRAAAKQAGKSPADWVQQMLEAELDRPRVLETFRGLAETLAKSGERLSAIADDIRELNTLLTTAINRQEKQIRALPGRTKGAREV